MISNGTVQSINIGPIAGIVSLLGGALQVDTRAVGTIASNSISTTIPV